MLHQKSILDNPHMIWEYMGCTKKDGGVAKDPKDQRSLHHHATSPYLLISYVRITNYPCAYCNKWNWFCTFNIKLVQTQSTTVNNMMNVMRVNNRSFCEIKAKLWFHKNFCCLLIAFIIFFSFNDIQSNTKFVANVLQWWKTNKFLSSLCKNIIMVSYHVNSLPIILLHIVMNEVDITLNHTSNIE